MGGATIRMRAREFEGGDLCGVFGVLLSCEVATV
jgi:hypothetical protein